MNTNDVVVLSRSDLRTVMGFGDYVEAVAEGFRQLAEGRSEAPVPLHLSAEHGTFHVKAATLAGGSGYVAVKINGNFPGNRTRNGLPTIQGAVFLADASNGRPLALLDAMEITLQRTGAATAVAGRHLARPDSRTATICGCGTQGPIQLTALRHALDLRRVFAWDVDPRAAQHFAAQMAAETGLDVRAVETLSEASRVSDVIVTCTAATRPFLGIDDVRPGTFIAAIGADNPHKSEIHPALMTRARVVVDVLEQSVVMGDLHHAITAGTMTAGDVHAELGAIIAGRRPGRQTAEEITLFDSSGTGVQDVAAAAHAYERARERGVGTRCVLGS
jgi:ornithine cyclodeaminase/alanine dehydrogenase-like protein (mu-crystallin family)